MIHKPRKLPVPKQRADKQWVVRWRIKINGREHRPQRLFYSERDANEWILRHLVDDSRLSPEDKRRTYLAIAERWLDGKRRKGVSPNTVTTYGYAIAVSAARFGYVAASAITPVDADEFATELSESGRSAKTLSLYWFVFRAVLAHAVRLKAATSDPSFGVDPPYAEDADDDERQRYHFLRPAEITALAAAFRPKLPPYEPLIKFTAYTGLRRFEVAGLNLGNVTLALDPDGSPTGGSVRFVGKGRKARTVPLPDWLAAELHEYICRHPHAGDPTAPLWPASWRDGVDWRNRLNPASFYSGPFRAAVKRAGLPEALRFHDLRHTYASLLAAEGVRIEVVAQLMGHADATITRKIYTHLWPEDLTDAVAVLAAPPPAQTAPLTNVVPLRPTGTE